MGIQSMHLAVEKPMYYAGEPIRGFCTVVVSSPCQLGVINMRFQGDASVSWSESHTVTETDSHGKSTTRTETHWYSSHQELACIHRDLVVQGGYFQPGTYSLPFSIDTPSSLVSSFEGAHGSVRYYVKAKKPKSGGILCLFDNTVKSYIRILQPIDTNIPTYMFPVSGCDNKTICCLCCASGPLSIEAKSDRAAYCPGDVAYITAHFDNKSSREVKPYIRLVQHQRFYAEGHSNFATKKYDLVPVAGSPQIATTLGENAEAQWDRIGFQIPPCYSSLKCRIIDVSYCLEICMDIPMAFDLQVTLPVVIATIPYRGPQVVTQQIQPSAPGWAGVGAQVSGQKSDALPAPPIAPPSADFHFEAPPPSYFATVYNGDARIAEEADAKKPKKK